MLSRAPGMARLPRDHRNLPPAPRQAQMLGLMWLIGREQLSPLGSHLNPTGGDTWGPDTQLSSLISTLPTTHTDKGDLW